MTALTSGNVVTDGSIHQDLFAVLVLADVAVVAPVAAFAGLPNAGAGSVPADTASAADSTAADHLLSGAGRRGVSVLIHFSFDQWPRRRRARTGAEPFRRNFPGGCRSPILR